MLVFNKKILFIFFCIFIFSFFQNQNLLFSQKNNQFPKKRLSTIPTTGKDYWIAFLKNSAINADENMDLRIIINSEKPNKVNIKNDSLNINIDYEITANSFIDVKLTHKLHLNGKEGIYNQVVHITSQHEISVIVVNSKCSSTDTYYAYSTESLGKSYHIVSYGSGSKGTFKPQFAIIGTEDSTIVEIIPSRNTNWFKKGKISRINLNKGQVFLGNTSNNNDQIFDLTGTKISANKKIALLVANESAWIPINFGNSNFIIEQMPPDSSYGRYFIVPKLELRKDYMIRLFSINDSNNILVGNAKYTLNNLEYNDIKLDSDVEIISDEPIFITQFCSSYYKYSNDTVGDPTMFQIVPNQLFKKSYSFKTPNNFDYHFINIVKNKDSKKKVLLDGIQIADNIFNNVPNSKYVTAKVKIREGNHKIESENPIGVYCYGYDCSQSKEQTDAYGHIAGMNFATYTDFPDTLAPFAELISNPNDTTNKAFIIISDKYECDRGLKELQTLSNTGLNFNSPKIEQGAKRVTFEIKPIDQNKSGKYVFEIIDLAGNKAYYTICYVYDEKLKKYVFLLNNGKNQDCDIDWKYKFGVFASENINFHQLDFVNTGNFKTNGNFSSPDIINNNIGISISKRINPKYNLTSNISLLNFKGKIFSPDSSTTKILKPNGDSIYIQELYQIELNKWQMQIDLFGEYNLNKKVYFSAGFTSIIFLNKDIDAVKKIVLPNDYYYTNGLRDTKENIPQNLESLSSFILGASIGVGYNLQITSEFLAFGEFRYNYYFTSVINDGFWNFGQISANLGIKYKLR